jgi:hypothetical protein
MSIDKGEVGAPCRRSDGKISYMRFAWQENNVGGYTNKAFDMDDNLWSVGISVDGAGLLNSNVEGEYIDYEY